MKYKIIDKCGTIYLQVRIKSYKESISSLKTLFRVKGWNLMPKNTEKFLKNSVSEYNYLSFCTSPDWVNKIKNISDICGNKPFYWSPYIKININNPDITEYRKTHDSKTFLKALRGKNVSLNTSLAGPKSMKGSNYSEVELEENIENYLIQLNDTRAKIIGTLIYECNRHKFIEFE